MFLEIFLESIFEKLLLVVVPSKERGKWVMKGRKVIFIVWKKNFFLPCVCIYVKPKYLKKEIMLILQSDMKDLSRLKSHWSLPLLWPSAMCIKWLVTWGMRRSWHSTPLFFFVSLKSSKRAAICYWAPNLRSWRRIKYSFLSGKNPCVPGDHSQLKIYHKTLHQVKVYN